MALTLNWNLACAVGSQEKEIRTKETVIIFNYYLLIPLPFFLLHALSQSPLSCNNYNNQLTMIINNLL